MTWFADSLGTIVVAAALGLAVFGIIRSMLRDRKSGKQNCGGNCGCCKGCH